MKTPNSVSCRRLLLIAVFSQALCLICPRAGAAPPPGQIGPINEENKAAVKPKDINADLAPRVLDDQKKAKGKADTQFNFHPQRVVSTDFNKDFFNSVIQPNPFTHTYVGPELHGTSGNAEYNLRLQKADKAFILTGKIAASIKTGAVRPPQPVSIQAKTSDPYSFSDVNLDAQLNLPAGGLDYSFSLVAGTAFPAFSQGPNSPGAIASGTSMLFQARVAPGLVSDPEEFWGSPVGGLDLFTLSIVSDSSHNITADLAFGIGTSAFTLDYRNHLGAVFDPTDSLAVDQIEAAIAAAFTAGAMNADLNDAFTVGIVPGPGVNTLTMGQQDTVTLSGLEIPDSGSTGALIAFAAAILICARARVTDRSAGA